jgi:hypothetical protein
MKTALVAAASLAAVLIIFQGVAVSVAFLLAAPVMLAWNFVMPERSSDYLHAVAALYLVVTLASFFKSPDSADSARS